MLASSSMKPSVAPSIGLLRFLRSQSDLVHFFTTNPTTKTGNSRVASERRWGNRRTKHFSWTDLHPAPCKAQLEASLFSLQRGLKHPNPNPNPYPSQPMRFPTVPSFSRNHPTPCFFGSRSASTETRKWWRRWYANRESYLKWVLSRSPPVTTFTDDGAEGNLFNLGRTLASKTLNEPRLRCTEFDENGNVTLVNGEFRKSELTAKVSFIRLLWYGQIGADSHLDSTVF
jgi:magnesium transporter